RASPPGAVSQSGWPASPTQLGAFDLPRCQDRLSSEPPQWLDAPGVVQAGEGGRGLTCAGGGLLGEQSVGWVAVAARRSRIRPWDTWDTSARLCERREREPPAHPASPTSSPRTH